MEKWYQKSYRRNLMDMHVNDWNDEFLSKFDIDDYFTYLKEAKSDAAVIKLQTHTGLCYYPTKSGKMHRAFEGREDTMRRLIDRCRANGIAAVGYYSMIFNTFEEDRHPEWRMVLDRKTGRSQRQCGGRLGRYGKCCPNNLEYRAFVQEQLREISEYFTLDGLFFDMVYWPGFCYCESCRKRFEAETGYHDLPDTDDLKNDVVKLFMKKRYEWIAEFSRFISDYARALMPHITISQNNACELKGSWREAVWEGVSDNSDYCAGDLYGDIFDHSFCMKFYTSVTPNMPFEYMVTSFAKDLDQHTLHKTQTQMDQVAFLTVAHHGANYLFDVIDPDGCLNHRVARLIGAAYEKQIPYEKYLYGQPMADVAIWYSTTGRYNSEGQSFDSRTCSAVLNKTFASNHVPFHVIGNTASDKLSRYQTVWAPAIAGLEDKHRKDLLSYVKEGGCLFFSGTEEPALLKEFLGIEVEGYTSAKETYVAPIRGKEALFFDFDEKYPLSMSHRHPLVRGLKADAEVEAYLKMPYSDPNDPDHFAAIHSNPPGVATSYPSVVRGRYGKGSVIWSALPIEGYDSYHHRKVAMCWLRNELPMAAQSVQTDAPSQVELIPFTADREILISAVDMGVTEDRISIAPFTVSVKTEAEPRQVQLLPNETPIAFSYQNGYVSFQTRALDLFDMYRILL